MTTIKDEIMALRAFIAATLTGVKFHLESDPATPAAGDISIRIATSSPTAETSAHNRIDRTYQIIYYGSTNIDVIDKAELLRKAFTNSIKINLGATGYVTVASFSMSQVLKADNGTPATIVMLELEIRETVDLPTYTKITGVEASIESN